MNSEGGFNAEAVEMWRIQCNHLRQKLLEIRVQHDAEVRVLKAKIGILIDSLSGRDDKEELKALLGKC